jgi:hypothetical protein
MPTISEANQRLSDLTAQISTLTRTVSLGVLALAWLFLSRSQEVSGLPSSVSNGNMLAIAALSILAISFDLLQYVMGYRNVDLARKSAQKNSKDQFKYPNDIYRKARFLFFYAKICFTVIAALWMVIVLAFAILH